MYSTSIPSTTSNYSTKKSTSKNVNKNLDTYIVIIPELICVKGYRCY